MKTKTKQTLSKITGELLPVAFGAGVAGIVRVADLPEGVFVLPPLLQLTQRYNPYFKNHELKPSLKRDILNTTKYGIGVALVYSDKLIPIVEEVARRI